MRGVFDLLSDSYTVAEDQSDLFDEGQVSFQSKGYSCYCAYSNKKKIPWLKNSFYSSSTNGHRKHDVSCIVWNMISAESLLSELFYSMLSPSWPLHIHSHSYRKHLIFNSKTSLSFFFFFSFFFFLTFKLFF